MKWFRPTSREFVLCDGPAFLDLDLKYNLGGRRRKRPKPGDTDVAAGSVPSHLLHFPGSTSLSSPNLRSSGGPLSASRAPAAGTSASAERPPRPGKMARRSGPRLLLLLLRYLVVALGYHRAYGFSTPKGHQVITAIEYQEAVLTCQYLKKTMASRLEWKKLGESVSFVYYEQALKGNFKGRAQMLDFNIRIRNVTRNDAGKYRCEVSTPSEQGPRLEEDTVTLEVLVAPGVPACEIPNSALSGTVVELRCQDKEANPAPEYTWFKNGIRLLGGPELDAQSTNSSYTMNTKSGTLQFNTVSKLDSGEYSCEARNSVGSRRCPGKRMQVDDLNISGIIAAVVIVALVVSVCGLGVCYAQRKGYFSRETSFQKSSSAAKATTMNENDFKHSKSFII